MCPAVISCAALTWMDSDPACVWFKGNTAGSQGSLALTCSSQVVRSLCLPRCCSETMCCDAPAVHVWLPFTPNCPVLGSRHFSKLVLVVRYVWHEVGAHLAVGFGPFLQDTGGRRCSCLACCSCLGTWGLVSLLLWPFVNTRFT